MAAKIELDLSEQGHGLYAGSRKVLVEVPGNGLILLRPEGTGDKCSPSGLGHPVALELYEGSVRILVWSDINQEDPTHVIPLDGALESARKES